MSDFHPHVHGMVAVPLGITFVVQAAKKKAGKGKKGVPAESDTFYQKQNSFSRRPTSKFGFFLIGQNYVTWSPLARRQPGKSRFYLAGHMAAQNDTEVSLEMEEEG